MRPVGHLLIRFIVVPPEKVMNTHTQDGVVSQWMPLGPSQAFPS
jgi:hypothetical protein